MCVCVLGVLCFDVHCDYSIETMIGSSWSPVVCKWAHPLFTVMCVCLRIVCPTHVVLCFSFVFLRLVYTMLPVFQEYPFLIALSVFTNVYLTIYHMIKIPVSRNISSYRPAYGKT
jgi:hypothetical protein